MNNSLNPDTIRQNRNSGQEVAKDVAKGPHKRRFGKSQAEYWKARLFHPRYTENGKTFELTAYACRIQFKGRRETFSLHSANKDVAAIQAKNIYLSLVSDGWEKALTKYKPEMERPIVSPTIGQFFAEAEAKFGLKPKTFRNYKACFRTIISGILGVRESKEKFDYRDGGHQKWTQQIDSVNLAEITPGKVQSWKVAFIKQAGSSPAAIQSARRTVNSYIRCSRSLFSPRLTKFLSFSLPDPLPFQGIELEKSGSMKYMSSIKIEDLVIDARKELKDYHPESYKVFLLGLFCGLRRAEIDSLEWTAFDWAKCTIAVSNTDTLSVKSSDSVGEVEVDQEVMNELHELMASCGTLFVINSHLLAKPGLDRQYYRCEPVFKHLTNWLRDKGIRGNKPLHELRKEYGSIINQKFGIYAASQALRHSDITTSARHYVAKKDRISAGLGHLLVNPENGSQYSHTTEGNVK